MMNSSDLRLPPMECLVAAMEAARQGSFSAAAEALGVTHATISRRVAAAEVWAGVLLFERHARGIRTTNEGQRLLARLAHAFADIDALVDRSRRPRSRTSIRISVTASFARFWLLPRLTELEKDDLHLDIVAEQRNADITAGEADLAVRYGRGGWPKVVATPLLDEVMVPAASNALPAPAGASVLDLALLHAGDTLLWRSWGGEHALSIRHKAIDRVMADYSLCLDAALAGHGMVLWNSGLHNLPAALRVVGKPLIKPPLRHYLLVAKGAQSVSVSSLVERLVTAR